MAVRHHGIVLHAEPKVTFVSREVRSHPYHPILAYTNCCRPAAQSMELIAPHSKKGEAFQPRVLIRKRYKNRFSWSSHNTHWYYVNKWVARQQSNVLLYDLHIPSQETYRRCTKKASVRTSHWGAFLKPVLPWKVNKHCMCVCARALTCACTRVAVYI